MSKNKWLQERVFVDEYGRPYNLSDVPMTVMTREEAFIKQGGSKKDVDKLWKGVKNERQKKDD